MGDPVNFEKARLRGIVPFGPGSHRNLVFEQLPRLGATAPFDLQAPPLGGEKPIDGGGTHGEKWATDRDIECECVKMFQAGDQVRQKRLEAFAGGKVQNGPAPDESGFRFGPIPGCGRAGPMAVAARSARAA